ncbi:1,4-dihydroxy-2-naphthoate polyprenyltransferase [Oceanirhabdus seepicola]|uniref:1,4-dihydroxy-2-naphthoate polyprenyltransferase n=1 Tax=Oceanirhabdus seepicola TaxID=2828781 RepID=A0A9J6P512_9CLOT|nr:1,4-dihydroxy-2-naphthoate polyprenyltransferase [Oceanirhabdus seepicola]MCM1991659.1 1,4-dihydroxy-2-naphthoate polyprenyltransferase [Oceanirhabdus seepicola]
MSLSSFLKLVEIQTKLASCIPFLLGNIYALYHYNQFNFKNFILMFMSLITFDMATTAINNYYDYKRAKKTHGYNYETHNAIVKDNLKEGTVIGVILSLLIAATIFGTLLFLNTNIVVLLLGMVSFLGGICYSFGPIPISRTPLGEIISGLLMGFIIVFLSIYIHVGNSLVLFSYSNSMLSININLIELIYIFMFAIPTVNCIANIMLANNICDIEDDKENERYTLPIYIGKDKALNLYKVLYYIVYIDIIIMIVLKIVPIVCVITLLTFILVNKNIKLFYEKQTKKDTFALAVKNLMIINVVQIVAMVVGNLIVK